MTTYTYNWHDTARLVSSIRVVVHGAHATFTIWTRGGNSGDLIIHAEDATKMAARLLGTTIDKLPAPEIVSQ